MNQVMTKLSKKKIAHPEDLVVPLVFLTSDVSSMVTGLVLLVDGGAAAASPIEWNPEEA